jgi:putative hydrolase of the HAD superfamily
LGVELIQQEIERSHVQSRQRGIVHPEVEIVQVWSQVLQELARKGVVDKEEWEEGEVRRLASEYEGRVNPVWPMPGLRRCLDFLRSQRLVLGIVSNAQFYTPSLFGALLGKPAEAFGFDPDLQYYSYLFGQAKPGTELHRMAARALAERDIGPEQVLYVGNDMLNDVLPSTQVGFRSALFAGDRRSLRWRRDHPQVRGVSPNVVLTRLVDLNGRVID